jgi:DNA-binding winged helix-turn-helix (wHTH) protein
VDIPRRAQSLRFGPFTLIPAERLLLKQGEPVSLTPKAFDVLSVVAAHPGSLRTKAELMEAVWPETAVEESNLAANIFAVRKALGEIGQGDTYIETVPRQGYRFSAPVVAGDRPGSSSPRSRSVSDSVRFHIPVAGRLAESGAFAISPDGGIWRMRLKASMASCDSGCAA